MIACNGLWSHKWPGMYIKRIMCTYNDGLNPRQRTPSSDPAQHAGDPPVARHDDLTDDAPSLVVVRPGVEAAQGLEVAAAVALTVPAALAAVAELVQTVIQLDSSLSLQRTQGHNHTHDKC